MGEKKQKRLEKRWEHSLVFNTVCLHACVHSNMPKAPRHCSLDTKLKTRPTKPINGQNQPKLDNMTSRVDEQEIRWAEKGTKIKKKKGMITFFKAVYCDHTQQSGKVGTSGHLRSIPHSCSNTKSENYSLFSCTQAEKCRRIKRTRAAAREQMSTLRRWQC